MPPVAARAGRAPHGRRHLRHDPGLGVANWPFPVHQIGITGMGCICRQRELAPRRCARSLGVPLRGRTAASPAASGCPVNPSRFGGRCSRGLSPRRVAAARGGGHEPVELARSRISSARDALRPYGAARFARPSSAIKRRRHAVEGRAGRRSVDRPGFPPACLEWRRGLTSSRRPRSGAMCRPRVLAQQEAALEEAE